MGWTITSSNIPKRAARLAGVCALGLALGAPASASLGDFRLPPAPSEPQPSPDVQGPVAPDVPESRGPAPTPTPSATAAAPVPTPSTAPLRPIARQPGAAQAPRQRDTQTTAASGVASTGVSPEAQTTPSLQAPVPDARPTGAPPTIPARNFGDTAGQGGSFWPWLLGGLLALAAVGFAGWAWTQRRQRPSQPVKVPQIERPRIAPATAERPVPGPSPSPAAGGPLQVALEPLRLSLTLINATLAYRLEIANRGTAPITDLRIGADMISAHASLSREEQLAGPRTAPQQRIERLEPGESRVVEGEFRVPFAQIVPIRQGSAALLLPLARFRLETEGADPIVRTFVVGQPGGAGLQPFRLDQGPRIYPRLAQRAFA